MSNQDQLHRYLFINHAVRGELVSVNDTYQQVLANHDYPPAVKKLLGEMLVATSLLTATLKFDGDITVQLQGSGGPLSLAVINGNNQQEMRGVARFKGEISDESTLNEMVGNGYLLITITPTKGERYQGVVALEGDTLAACLENYFMQSEQLPTRLFIRTGNVEDKAVAGGMLLQILPAQERNENEFDHLAQLTATIKAEELFTLPASEVLYRLYHQEEVTLYEPQNVSFRCTCSRERCADALVTLSEDDINEMLEQIGNIDMHCEYCGNHYLFDAVDIALLKSENSSSSEIIH